jgi:long-chain fatty acid transport protein
MRTSQVVAYAPAFGRRAPFDRDPRGGEMVIRGFPRLGATLVVWLALAAMGTPSFANTDPAFTGIAAPADDAVSANTNPAGLTRIQRPEWVGQAIIYSGESEFVVTTTDTGERFKDDNSSSTFVPTFYYARPLTDRLGFGIYLTGMTTSDDYDDDGAQRFRIEDYTLGYAAAVPSLAYRLNDKWSLGAGLAINYSFYELNTAIFLGEGQPEGRLELDADDVNLSFVLGALYEHSPRTRLGLTYTSERDPELSGTPDAKGVPDPIKNLLEREIALQTTFPQTLIGGFYHELESGSEVTFDLLWTEFSEFGFSEISVGDLGNSIQVDVQDFDNTWGASVGYSRPLNDLWTVKVGGLYFDSPVSDENRTVTWRLDDLWGLGVGAERRFSDRRILGFNLNYLDIGEAPLSVEDPAAGTLVGKFSERYGILLDLSFRWITRGS